ncbi:MAG: hypothetical protein ACFE85_19540, partial [Candidatus Hodarchaeota archaeon]
MWILSLISGMIALTSLITPAWGIIVSSYSFFVWFWGLEVSTDLGIRIVSTPFLILGIIASLLILMSGLLLIYISYKNYKDKTIYKKLWIILGITIILAPIIYLVGLEILFPSFFGEYKPVTIFIGPVISSILAILAG